MLSKDKIKETLLAKGLTEEEIKEILESTETPKPKEPEVKKELIAAGLSKEEAEDIARKIVEEAIGKGFYKCSGCGNMIKKEDPICYKCNLIYNKDSQKWEDYQPKISRRGKEIKIAGFKVDEIEE